MEYQASYPVDIEAPRPERSKVAWFTWPTLIPLVFLPGLILLATPGEYLAGAMLAYVNCLIGGCGVVHFVRQRTLGALIPVLMLTLLLLAWPVASIYFAIFDNDISYVLRSGTLITNLSGNVRLQLVTLIFLVSYLAPAMLLIRKPPTVTPTVVTRGRSVLVACGVLGGVVLVVGLNILSKLITLPDTMVYIVDGSLLYFNGLTFVIGAYFGHLPKSLRVFTLAFLVAAGYFYTLGNARGMALVPFGMFLFGLLFCADVSQKWKLSILGLFLVLFPVYIVIGNTTRVLLRRGGGFEDLSYRAQVLGRWREVRQSTSALSATLGRLFFTGGHSIVTRTPEQLPYMDFSLTGYTTELLGRLLPARFYYNPYYGTNANLLRYGFLITETTSVEISLIGGMWMLGGAGFVVAGGVASALLHAWLARILRKAGESSPHKALVYMGVIGPGVLFWTSFDLISDFRTVVWRLIAAGVLYYLGFYWLVTGETERSSREPSIEYAATA